MITWIKRNLIINTKNGVRLKSRVLSPIESPISVMVWYVLNEISTIPLCPVCGKELNCGNKVYKFIGQ